MNNDEDFMIIGAKKKSEKNYDKHEISICIQYFRKLILAVDGEANGLCNRDSLIQLASEGDLEKNFIRPTVWKLFLGIIPFDKTIDQWVDIVAGKRAAYKQKLKDLTSLKKLPGDPLGNPNDTGWNSFFEETERKKIIVLDVNRTYQDKELFQSTVIKEILVNILFIWSKENKDVAYKQGMHEVLAVILYSFYPFYCKNTSQIPNETLIECLKDYSQCTNYSKELYMFLHDEDELQADLYYLFDSVMNQGIKELFESGVKKNSDGLKKRQLLKQQWTNEDDSSEKDQPPLNQRCSMIIKEKLRTVDEELYNHFVKIDINCTIFLQRWLKCIFNREFHPKDVSVIWDAIFAHENLNTVKNGASFIFIDLVAVAMIIYIREDLLKKDQNDCFQRLFKYPPIETPVILIKLAEKVRKLIVKKDMERIKAEEESCRKRKEVIIEQPGTTKLTVAASFSEKRVLNVNTPISQQSTSINELPQPEANYTVNIPSNSISEINSKLVSKLENMLKKYKHIFEDNDASDLEQIIETMKSQL